MAQVKNAGDQGAGSIVCQRQKFSMADGGAVTMR